MNKFKTLLIAGIALTTLFSGCSVKDSSKEKSGNDSQNVAALNEKELNIYTALEDEQVASYLESFRQAHPDVLLNITRESTGIITSKLLAEKDNPRADVIWGVSATSLLVLKSENMLRGYAPKGVERVLETFKDISSEAPKWVGIDAWETAFLVNKDVLASHGVKTVPETYEDLLKKEYKGLIAMSDPGSSGTGLLTVNGILSLYGEEKGWEYLKKLDENVAVYLHSGSAPAKQAAAGEYGIGVSSGYRCIKSAADIGDNGAYVFPKEGSGYDIEANALVARKEGEKNIAKEFLDWAIADEQMKLYATFGYPMISTGATDVMPEGYSKNAVDQLLKIDFDWCAMNRERILEKWTNMFSAKTAK
ncbi:MAG: extracellular solute-binding protein [Fibrobacteraceae bacterium]|nr:extracellular solute-binding protein [Fibrobacteraceae bacterium]